MAMNTGKVVALIQAMGGGADPAVIESAVQDWLDAHPEATTTVQDGSITEAKLATTVAQKLGLISSLSDEIDGIGSDVTDLKSALSAIEPEVFNYLTATTKTGLYVDDGGYVGTANNSRIVILDLTSLTDETISVTISGTSNRCRLLKSTAFAESIVSGAGGVYVDKGNTTTSFTMVSSEYTGYKSLVICTNYNLTPFATVEARTTVSRIDALETEKQDKSNLVIAIDATSEDTQYPSAKCVYDALSIDVVERIKYADMDTEQTGLLNNDGSASAYANAYISDYIICNSETEIEYNLRCIVGYIGIAFYDSTKAFISGIAPATGTPGSWATLSGASEIPANAAYFRFTVGKNNDTQYVQFTAKANLASLTNTLYADASKWRNKKWCAFGTSITDTDYPNPETGGVTGYYVPKLAALSGLVYTDRGIAGGTIGSGGIDGGSSTILNAILACNDLDDFDLITLEGFVNDFACAVTIGGVGDTQNTTFCGALYQAITYILQNSHAELVLLTETTGQRYTMHSTGNVADYTILKKNKLDLYQRDYNNAIIKMGQYYGVRVIDAGGKSQVNQYHPEYIADQIHHTELGGEQYARTIWAELKNVYPAAVANP